eukprot:TRINITY_DN112969_c0_g1_i1.p1 TRINITY_DN112969_c0_g1~~TRINITY_DN112969_c0_g1_i1.p1  ORF type:complete len:894 (-),score=232.14 TRINITY_DN112969_c0_g1_i1:141-2822(-)
MADSALAAKAAGREILPDAVIPSRYDLRLVPDLQRYIFDGSVRIAVDVNEATDEITLHARDLLIQKATFESADGSETIEVDKAETSFKKKTLKLSFASVLPVGKGSICIDFVGELNDQMAGFYRSSYKDIHGTTKTMASTQFESIDARRCFPCWDEPARKAIFAVTMVVDPDVTALCNTPEKSSKFVTIKGKRLKEVLFMDSPKMSTYLLAFVVGEFDYIQASTANGVLVRVYTPPGRAGHAAFSLEAATKCLDLYDDFFGLPYPLPKLDMVAIPEFAAGAMENWGLVTYREVDLLIDPKVASGQQKQRVFIVVAHELAHQWFGNLVTMAWWDDLWLNEGFASWCENYSTDIIRPDYKMWDQFPSDTLAASLRLDALLTSHPIQVPIHAAEEVEEVFDAISYCKGCSVIRMAHAVLGHEAFKKGLQDYMKKHQYSNTETFHLWDAWASSSGLPVKDLMSSWTEQMGFPLLEVKECTFVAGVAKLKLEQSWFLSTGDTPEARKWTIPLFIRTLKKQGAPPVMMKEATMDVDVPLSGESGEFVLINENVVTPMRVLYTPEMYEKLEHAVKAGQLGASDKSGLLMDAYALAKAGKLGVDALLRLVVGFSKSSEYVVWDALSAVLVGLQTVIMGGAPESVYNSYMAFVQKFVTNGWKAANLGWDASESDGHTGGLLREVLFGLVQRFGEDPAFVEEARKRFDKYMEDTAANGEQLKDEIRVPVLKMVLKSGGEAEYSKLLDAYKTMETNQDKKQVYQAVGYSKESRQKKAALMWSISGDIKIQDFFYVMGSVRASSKEGLHMAWEFLQNEFEAIRKMTKDASPSIMDGVIQSCINGYASAKVADDIETFFEKNPLPQNKRTISQALERIRSDAKFLDMVLASDVVKVEFWDSLDKLF